MQLPKTSGLFGDFLNSQSLTGEELISEHPDSPLTLLQGHSSEVWALEGCVKRCILEAS